MLSVGESRGLSELTETESELTVLLLCELPAKSASMQKFEDIVPLFVLPEVIWFLEHGITDVVSTEQLLVAGSDRIVNDKGRDGEEGADDLLGKWSECIEVIEQGDEPIFKCIMSWKWWYF